jgi:hypothetical protein
MRYDADFNISWRVDDPVAIRDIIESLQGVETVLRETAGVLPQLVRGLDVEHFEIKVRTIAQQSPLKELFVLTMFLAFQKSLETAVPGAIEQATGTDIPANLEVIVTLTALIVVFYGVGAIKDFLVGSKDGPSAAMLQGLIDELSKECGLTPEVIRARLAERYADKSAWKRVTNAAARFFRVSKRQDSSPMLVNGRQVSAEVVRDVPADYLFDDAREAAPARPFYDVPLELHAQDRDHSGQGWAAVIPGIVDRRVRLKLLSGVSAADLWNRDRARGDVMVIYERVGDQMIPKSIQLQALLD